MSIKLVLLAFEYSEFMEFPRDTGILHSGIMG